MEPLPPSRLVVMHYHLLPGGVTTVIRDGLIALATQQPPAWLQEIVVAAGTADGGGASHHRALARAVAEARRAAGGADRGPQVDVVVEPGLSYRAARSTARDQRELAAHLRDRFGAAAVWWVHNYHLGKNTAFTGAVLHAAAMDQALLLQIHDFPEGGRLANLRRVVRDCVGPRYPVGSNLHYVTINNRDRRLLVEAGIPTGTTSLLANPVSGGASTPPLASAAAATARSRLFAATAAVAAAWSGRLDPGLPVWLYPVRARRRKNLLEAGLLARLSAANLIVTLPAVSRAERTYGSLVAGVFRSGLVQGSYGIGAASETAGISFADLVAASDLVVSSSIEEGFGYSFINAVQWQRPLLARRLHVAADLAGVLHGYPALFYDTVRCGLTRSELATTKRRYRRAIRRIGDGTATREALLEAELEARFGAGIADFSFLPATLQRAVLLRSAQAGYRDELLDLNRGLLADIQSLGLPDLKRQATAQTSVQAAVAATYGPAAFARDAFAILDSLRNAQRVASDHHDTGHADVASVEGAFATVETARMVVTA